MKNRMFVVRLFSFALVFMLLIAQAVSASLTETIPTIEEVEMAQQAMEQAAAAWEAAETEKTAAETALKQAEQQLLIANTEYAEAKESVAELEQKLDEADAECKKAEEAVREAEENIKNQDYSASDEYLALQQAKGNVIVAESFVESQTQVLAEATAACNEAETVLENAKKDLETARINYDNLLVQIEAQNAALAQIQEETATAQTVYDAAVINMEQAEIAYREAMTVTQSAETSLEKERAALKQAETALAEYDKDPAVQETLQEIADLKAEYNTGAFAFFKAVAADENQSEAVRKEAQYALNWLNHAKGQGWIVASGSATSISNMQHAITNLYRCNTVLSSEGIRTLDVSLWLMAHAQVSSDRNNADYYTHHHLEIGAGAENQLVSYTHDQNPYGGWYHAEKEMAEAGETEGIGHYQSLIYPGHAVTGYGVSSGVNPNGSPCLFQIQQFAGYEVDDSISGIMDVSESAMTVAQYEALLNGYISDYEEKLAALEDTDGARADLVTAIENAEQAVKDAEAELAAAKADLTAKTEAYDAAIETKEAAGTKLADLNERVASITNTIERLEANKGLKLDEVTSAEAIVANCEANLTTFSAAKEAAEEELDAYKADLKDAEAAEEEAQKAFDDLVAEENKALNDTLNEAKEAQEKAQKEYDALEEKRVEAVGVAVTAENNVNIAEAGVTAAQFKVDETSDTSAQKKAMEEATEYYHQIKAAYDAAHQPIQTGWVLEEDTWYYYDADGSMHIGWLYVNNSWYYLDESGAMVTGLQIVDGRMSHFNAGGVWEGYVSKGWRKDCGNWYYVGLNGELAKGWKQVGGIWYYMNEEGVMQTGWQKIGSVWYFLNSSGAMVTGWQQIGKTWYYFTPSGAMKTGWLQQGNVWYYLNFSGAMVTGDVMIDGALNCFNAQGVWKGYAAPGWKLLNQKWYYVNGGGKVTTGWKLLGNTWYFFNESGVMQTGWQKIGGVWYFLNRSGAMVTGWQQIGKTWYYFRPSGAMVTGTVELSGITYTFSDSGAWIQ